MGIGDRSSAQTVRVIGCICDSLLNTSRDDLAKVLEQRELIKTAPYQRIELNCK